MRSSQGNGEKSNGQLEFGSNGRWCEKDLDSPTANVLSKLMMCIRESHLMAVLVTAVWPVHLALAVMEIFGAFVLLCIEWTEFGLDVLFVFLNSIVKVIGKLRRNILRCLLMRNSYFQAHSSAPTNNTTGLHTRLDKLTGKVERHALTLVDTFQQALQMALHCFNEALVSAIVYLGAMATLAGVFTGSCTLLTAVWLEDLLHVLVVRLKNGVLVGTTWNLHLLVNVQNIVLERLKHHFNDE